MHNSELNPPKKTLSMDKALKKQILMKSSKFYLEINKFNNSFRLYQISALKQK